MKTDARCWICLGAVIVAAGSYTLRAVATDGVGQSATSAPVNIFATGSVAATNTLVPHGATWKYLDDGTDQGTAWQAAGFEDASWKSGPAQLGYGDGDEATVISYGSDPKAKHITYYFRHTLVVTNAALYSALNLQLLYDDGAVVHLNGNEVYRTPTMPAGTITYTVQSANASDNTVGTVAGLANSLVAGTNVLAVEIHQDSLTSSDVSFDFALEGVFENVPPIVFITSPAPYQAFDAPADVPISVAASDADGTVVLVEVFQGATKLGEDAVAPYQVTWNNATVGGIYPLHAVATDNLGARSTSAVVPVTIDGNYRPTVTLTDPPHNAVFVVPTNVVLVAAAADSDGTVAQVAFHANGVHVGSDSTSPFSVAWNNSQAGTFALTAVATDHLGLSATSAPVSVLFLEAAPPGVLVAQGSAWRYLDTGADPGAAWAALAYDDSGWSNGLAQLGFGDGDEITVMRRNPTNSSGVSSMAFYFRQAFAVPDAALYKSFILRMVRDDGAVVYLNGTELYRDNMPAGAIDYLTPASSVTPDERAWRETTVLSTPLVSGLNLLAAEVHQNVSSSSDASFDLELIGITTNGLPVVTLTAPLDNAVVNEPANIPLTATATDRDGTVTNVQFHVHGTPIGPALTLPPYSYVWQNQSRGTYAFQAVATDNLGDSRTSSVVTVFVVASTTPTIASFVPAPGTVSSLSQVAVNFTEPVDNVKAADLLVNGLPATGVTGANAAYVFTFSEPAEGAVGLTWSPLMTIADRELPPKPFAGTGPGETALYTLVDTLAPAVVARHPFPGATLAALSEIRVLFSEPVGGVDAADLLANGQPASRVTGSSRGPYTFEFVPLTVPGAVHLAWATSHGIHDFSAAQNALASSPWTYTLDSNTPQAGIVINEIMYHPSSESTAEEYIELHNTSTAAVNLTGWTLSDGVAFTFTNATLPARGYLVVAANPAVFQAKYPAVTNVVGGWDGILSNNDDDIDLNDAEGNRVDSVHYADEGDWAVRIRSVAYPQGWDWLAEADGGGRSLELVNAAMPNAHGQNWRASAVVHGTPGAVNSAAAGNIAPLIVDVQHAPVVPTSGDPVTITARILDESAAGVSVILSNRNASTTAPPEFSGLPMADDGQHGDGLAGDGVYGAVLSPMTHGTVIEFFVWASDGAGNIRTWPAAARQAGGTTYAQTCNALFQVDNETCAGAQPCLRLIMTETERSVLAALLSSQPTSDAEMNATFVSVDRVQTRLRYNISIRFRGAGSRGYYPPNYHVGFPSDRRWDGRTDINLNTRYTYSQVLGSVMTRKAGLTAEEALAVQVRVNGVNLAGGSTSIQQGSYVLLEHLNADFADNHFPLDPNGNVYKCMRPSSSLAYLGTAPQSYINAGYAKQSNESENDWTDLIRLTDVLNNIPDAQYAAAVQQVLDPLQWVRYFAVMQMVGYGETSLGSNGDPDDFSLYSGVRDPRFLIFTHDHDTDFGIGGVSSSRSLWSATANAVVNRFLRWPDFVPLYFAELKRMCDTTFSAEQFNPETDRMLGAWVNPTYINSMKTWMANRRAYVLSQIPLDLTLETALPLQNGYYYTPTPGVSLAGSANAITTRAVRVNGLLATWSAWEARWAASLPLQPGINRVTVESLDAAGAVTQQAAMDIWHDDGSVVSVGGTVSGNPVWTAAGGPYLVTGTLLVPYGSILTLEAGTTVYFNQGGLISIAGQLLAQGTADRHIRLTRQPGTAATWGGLHFNDSQADNRLVYVDFDGADTADAIVLDNSNLLIDHAAWSGTTRTVVDLYYSSAIIRNCVFPALADNEVIRGVGMPPGGHVILQSNHFAAATGHSDIIAFSGGQRPGPILQVLDNTFHGSNDDALDLNGADAHIEGNLFMNIHQDAPRDNASFAIATDAGAAIAAARNVFHDVDHALLLKNGASAVLQNNTVTHVRTNAAAAEPAAAIAFGEPQRLGATGGAGAILDGNIFWDVDAGRHFLHFTNGVMFLSVDYCLLSGTNHPGTGNLGGDPRFVNPADDWHLAPGSPALGAGPNGLDMGAFVPPGATVAGEPLSPTPRADATLTVAGPGMTHYRYQLNGGSFGAETSITNPIALAGLTQGVYSVGVLGKNSAGVWQPTASPTLSRTWAVNGAARGVWIHEVLARNDAAVELGGRHPDLVELHNSGATPVSLAGMSLTDNRDLPRKFVFPPGASLAPGDYVVLFADAEATPPGLHLGFTLRQEGDDLHLFGADGRLLDSLAYGVQLPDYSIGRDADGVWVLNIPTFGEPNQTVPTGDPHALLLNEWLAAPAGLFTDDFLEIYNPSPLPIDLSGVFLTDNPMTAPIRHEIGPLTFVAPGGFLLLIADGNVDAGANHTDFRLANDQGLIGLFDADVNLIDSVYYGPQSVNVSMGRSPNGSTNLVAFPIPTPGSPNPAPAGPGGTQVLLNEVLAKNASLPDYDGVARDWVELYNASATTVDLAGFSLSDDPLLPRRWVFPSGVSLAPGACRVVCFAPDEPPSTRAGPRLNTGFGINANGETVYLFDRPANGGSLLDAVTYGVQAADYSIGRLPDGSTNWVLTTPTTNLPNLVNFTPGNRALITVNEWMADPKPGEDDWFELHNPSLQPVDLGGLWLTDNPAQMKFQIPPLSFLGTELHGFERFIADENTAAGADHVSFKLSGSGESIGLFVNATTPIDVVTFGLQIENVSQGRLPDGAAAIVSFPATATPGDANYLPLPAIVIHEVMSHSDSPYEDAIELHNTSDAPVAIGGWYLSDARRNLKKYQIPAGTSIHARGYKVFYESASFFADPVSPFSFSLDSAHGDEVYVAEAVNHTLTGYRAQIEFGAAERNVPFGRHTNSAGAVHVVALHPQTFGVDSPDTVAEFQAGTGKANGLPKVGPIAIHEIMYHPPDLLGADNVRDEYIELINTSATNVPLYHPLHPTNTWRLRDAVSFQFPTSLTLLPGDLLLVVSFNPVDDPATLAQFRAAYGIPAATTILGPYTGKLDNGGESVELCMPDIPEPPGDPDAGFVPYILVERVEYSDAAPWPGGAVDGGGWSIHRIDPTEYGNDPANWRGESPTPGPGGIADTDGDGMPDAYEDACGLNPLVHDAALDLDGDGMANYNEYLAGTLPNDPASLLNLTVRLVAGSPRFSFTAVQNLAYAVDYQSTLTPGTWLTLTNVPAQPFTHTELITDFAPGTTRFYRLRMVYEP
ncbi:MAG: lamin tail domain-containing protein [Verrucomicrobia bacterium]|nr:lamin tail domain-containing protein [Verrucomicrobiota bacterium]